jgi:glycyl-tRNA synthetase beta chain
VQALDSAAERVDPLIDTEDFHGAMSVYSTLRPVVDAFFNNVTVNAPEPEIRVNRLRLLSRIRGTLNKIADFSRIA